MSEVLITRRGSGGGLSPNRAVIHVKASTGSTISFSKGGAALKVLGPDKSHVNADDNDFADWYFPVSYANFGEWTVTATREDDSSSKTVVVDSNEVYDVELLYKLYIFRSGYGFVNGFTTVSAGSFTRNDNYLQWESDTSGFAASPTVNTSIYSKLCCELEVTSVDSDTYKPTFGLSTNTNVPTNSGGASFVVKKMCSTMARAVVRLDITGYNSSYYFKFTEFYFRGKIYNIWFE